MFEIGSIFSLKYPIERGTKLLIPALSYIKVIGFIEAENSVIIEHITFDHNEETTGPYHVHNQILKEAIDPLEPLRPL